MVYPDGGYETTQFWGAACGVLTLPPNLRNFYPGEKSNRWFARSSFQISAKLLLMFHCWPGSHSIALLKDYHVFLPLEKIKSAFIRLSHNCHAWRQLVHIWITGLCITNEVTGVEHRSLAYNCEWIFYHFNIVYIMNRNKIT